VRFLSIPMVFLVLGIVACKSVHPADIQGTWILRDDSRQVLPAGLRNAEAKVVLDKDGAFVVSNLPGLFFFSQRRDARFESGSGVWKLVTNDGEPQVQLEFRQIVDWRNGELPYGTQLNISKGWSTTTLYYFLGDPDSGARIEFSKR
jgi:hypothetical protein